VVAGQKHEQRPARVQSLDTIETTLAIAGDRDAFSALYRRWHPKLFRLALRLTRDQTLADDVMQASAMTIAKNIRRLKDPEKFSAWAMTIVRRRAVDHIRSNIQDRSLRDRTVQSLPAEQATDPESLLTLKTALGALVEANRTLLTLFYLDGFTGPELAIAMGLPLGTIKSRLSSARRTLKSHYLATIEESDHD